MIKSYNINDTIGNFKVENKTWVEEVDGTLYEFKHSQSGARLIFLSTNDKNKLFSVSFKTIPDNNTGVFHILEHSVLNGSKKYPVKEPFVELIKGSMNTFLNAMTFPDKTMYPVSSRNEKDFMNLTSVYLDAVFAPAIYTNPSIFRQEGWHYDFNEDGDMYINGVVFNEMKGCESSVEERIVETITRELFPDNCYSKNSGGWSPEIPELTYEDFVSYHKKFYSPSNAIFYLEGDINLESPLALIEEYLSGSEKTDISFTDIPIQNKVGAKNINIQYPISEEENTSQKTNVAFAKVIGSYEEKEKVFALSLLSEYLTGSLESPLTAAILNKELAQDIHFVFETSIQQPFFYISVSNTDPEKIEEIRSAIKDVVENECKNGLNKEELTATLNHLEFSSREIIEPRALHHAMAVLSSYLYGGKPELYLTYNEMFKSLRQKIDTGYFEELLKDLLSDDGMCTIIAQPSKTLAEEEIKAEAQRCKELQNSWDEDTIKEKKRIVEELQVWQQTPDTREKLDLMPKLSISDVDEKPEEFITIEKKIDDVVFLNHPVSVTGVGYINMYFPVPAKYQDKMDSLSYLTNMLSNIPTKNFDVLSLNRKIKSDIGHLSFDYTEKVYGNSNDNCTTYVVVRISTLTSKAKESMAIVKEIVLNTIFDSKEMVKKILLQNLDSFRNEIIESGHAIGTKRAAASFSARASLVEKIEGISCYEKLKDICSDIDNNISGLIELFENASKEIFTSNGLVIGLSASQNDLDIEETTDLFGIRDFVLSIPKGEQKCSLMTYKMEKEALVNIPIPAQVSYACSCSNMSNNEEVSDGSWAVATNLTTFQFLWNEVRVQGGAYGVGTRTNRFGDVLYYSYRDPDGERSYSVYSRTADFLDEFASSDESLEKFIISTVASREPLIAPINYGNLADSLYLEGTTYEQRCKTRLDILHTTKDDLKRIATILREIEGNTSRVIVGNVSDKEKCDKIINL